MVIQNNSKLAFLKNFFDPVKRFLIIIILTVFIYLLPEHV